MSDDKLVCVNTLCVCVSACWHLCVCLYWEGCPMSDDKLVCVNTLCVCVCVCVLAFMCVSILGRVPHV